MTQNLVLYHYASSLYPTLQTRQKQGLITAADLSIEKEIAKKIGKPGAYSEHISFFFEKIPLDILGSIFGKDHHVWFSGNVLFEYRVDANSLSDFKYEIVESPQAMELYYDDSIQGKHYVQAYNRIMRDKGYRGQGASELLKAVAPLKVLTRLKYQQITTRPNWGDIRKKYAATVPHVLIYPNGGEIKYTSVQKTKVA